jgi:hypothetical protein
MLTRKLSKRILPACALAAFSAVALTAGAQTTTWIGGTGDWGTAGNWSAGVPAAGGTALVDNGNVASSTASVGSSFNVATLHVSSGDHVRVTAGTLTVTQRTLNAGTLTADGGTLVLQNSGTFSDNTGGTVRAANASEVRFNSIWIANGTLTSTGSGVVRMASGFNYLQDITNTGNLTLDGGARFDPRNTVTNHGSINLNGNMELSGVSVTLNGSGVTNVNFTNIWASAFVGTFTNNSTIQGFGRVGNSLLNMVNTGTIVANVPGQTLRANAAGSDTATTITFQNSGTLMAAGGTLQIGQVSEFVRLNNTGGRIIANGSDVNIRGEITGGTLSSTAGGVIRVNSNGFYLGDAANNGNITVDTGGVFGLRGVVTNNGSINLVGNPSFTSFDQSGGSATLVGTGAVNVSGVAIRAIAGAGTLINNSTIQGGGFLGTVGGSSLNFTNNGVVHANSGTLALDGGAGWVNNGVLRVSGGAGMQLRGNLSLSPLTNNGSIDIASDGTFSATQDARFSGGTAVLAGTLELSGTSFGSNPAIGTLTHFRGTGRLNVLGNSRLNLAAGGGTLGTSKLGSFNFGAASPGKLNINDHALIWDYTGASPIVTLRQTLRTAYRPQGDWTGPGLTSDLATAAAASPTAVKTGIGYVSAADFGLPSSFEGVPIDATSLLMKYTILGDTDLNGELDFDDYARIDAGFLGTGTLWIEGDFNYDGVVDFDDYAIIDNNFLILNSRPGGWTPDLLGVAGLDSGITFIPEPSAVGLCALVTVLARRRRR